MILLETFPAGPLECNCTVLACGDTKDAVIIDPGGATDRIAELVAHYDLTVRAIIHTHAHIDHIYCTKNVAEAHGGAICLHKDDHLLYKSLPVQAAMFGIKPKLTRAVDRFIVDGDRIEFGKQAALVLHTPGHTPGSVCFELQDENKTYLFAGDTLFRRGIGRTDLPGGDSRAIVRSIRDLYRRDLDAVVIPGHGPRTTLGEEARANPFVSG